MAGTCNSVRYLPTSALTRAEVTGDFGSSLNASTLRSVRHDVAIAGTIKLLHGPPVLPGQFAVGFFRPEVLCVLKTSSELKP
jgi:hypothetical protein